LRNGIPSYRSFLQRRLNDSNESQEVNMPRTNPFTGPQLYACRELKQLRKALQMSRSEFAVMTGVKKGRLQNHELERVPWSEKELRRIKGCMIARFAEVRDNVENAMERVRPT
jgi:DNA-binding transcriptional regulator YiaG